jgi:hypothetical protein
MIPGAGRWRAGGGVGFWLRGCLCGVCLLGFACMGFYLLNLIVILSSNMNGLGL